MIINSYVSSRAPMVLNPQYRKFRLPTMLALIFIFHQWKKAKDHRNSRRNRANKNVTTSAYSQHLVFFQFVSSNAQSSPFVERGPERFSLLQGDMQIIMSPGPHCYTTAPHIINSFLFPHCLYQLPPRLMGSGQASSR